jgi:hypothetical protein
MGWIHDGVLLSIGDRGQGRADPLARGKKNAVLLAQVRGMSARSLCPTTRNHMEWDRLTSARSASILDHGNRCIDSPL